MCCLLLSCHTPDLALNQKCFPPGASLQRALELPGRPDLQLPVSAEASKLLGNSIPCPLSRVLVKWRCLVSWHEHAVPSGSPASLRCLWSPGTHRSELVNCSLKLCPLARSHVCCPCTHVLPWRLQVSAEPPAMLKCHREALSQCSEDLSSLECQKDAEFSAEEQSFVPSCGHMQLPDALAADLCIFLLELRGFGAPILNLCC